MELVRKEGPTSRWGKSDNNKRIEPKDAVEVEKIY